MREGIAIWDVILSCVWRGNDADRTGRGGGKHGGAEDGNPDKRESDNQNVSQPNGGIVECLDATPITPITSSLRAKCPCLT